MLREHGVEPEIIEYLKTPPTEDEVARLLDLMGMEPRELLRRREREYKEHGLGDGHLSREDIIRLMVRHPRVIERPIVVHGDRAVLGRPTEKVLEVL